MLELLQKVSIFSGKVILIFKLRQTNNKQINKQEKSERNVLIKLQGKEVVGHFPQNPELMCLSHRQAECP